MSRDAREVMAEFSNRELLDEIERRCAGVMLVACSVDEGNRDSWQYRVKGSNVMIGAMSAALSMQVSMELQARADAGHNPLS